MNKLREAERAKEKEYQLKKELGLERMNFAETKGIAEADMSSIAAKVPKMPLFEETKNDLY